MQLRSNSLYHFTPKMEYLIDILQNGFWPRYCCEYGWGNEYVNFALPMICFCDIPLSLIEEHTTFYGNFGIGMKRGWALKQKFITPVQYINLKSTEYLYIRRCLTKLKNNKLDEGDRRSLCLAKKVSSKVYTKDGIEDDKILYNEREWRYIPEEDENFKIIPIPQNETNYDLDVYSNEFVNKKVKIDIPDIQYLIVPSDYYRDRLIKQLKQVYKNYPEDVLLNIMSRIITVKQILNDF